MIQEHGKYGREAVTQAHIQIYTQTAVCWQEPHWTLRQAKPAFDWWEVLFTSSPPPPLPLPWLHSISFHSLTIAHKCYLSLSHFPWIFSSHIHPVIPEAEILAPYLWKWKIHTASCIIPAAGDFTQQQPAQYLWPYRTYTANIVWAKAYSNADLDLIKYSSMTQVEAEWCDVLPVSVHYSSVQTRP